MEARVYELVCVCVVGGGGVEEVGGRGEEDL